MTDTHPADDKTDALFVTDPREAKLPRWAQHLLAQARRRMRDAEKLAEVARLDTDPAGSTMLLDAWRRHDGGGPIGLGTRASVTAVVGDRRYGDGKLIDYVEFSVHEGVVEVRGSSQLVIVPQATNAITITVKKD